MIYRDSKTGDFKVLLSDETKEQLLDKSSSWFTDDGRTEFIDYFALSPILEKSLGDEFESHTALDILLYIGLRTSGEVPMLEVTECLLAHFFQAGIHYAEREK
jgi:hypothetical protein